MPTQYFSRLPRKVTLNGGAPSYQSVDGFKSLDGPVRTAAYSPDGKYFAYSTPGTVTIVNPDDGSVVSTIRTQVDVVEIGFSPQGTYVLTWERPRKDKEGSGNWIPNLGIWLTKDGSLVASYVQNSSSPWAVQFSHDEKYCARLVTKGRIEFTQGAPGSKAGGAVLELEGATEFSMSPGQNYSVAVFVPESKGRPAIVRVYQIPSFGQPVSQKTFFKADKVQMKWNKLGTALLVLASTDVDSSGKSYYGETNLYLLGIAGSYDSRISLDKEGTIHEVAWSPSSREFAVVYGYMPAKTTIFDARGNAVHSFSEAARNTVMFSPHGRFVLLAGFGNLQGAVDIYDRQRQFQKVTSFEAPNTSVCQWSPDGRYILTATTSPRLRVDNGVRLWHYTGKLVYVEDHEELFAAQWRPQDVSQYPLRASLSPAPAPHASVTNSKTGRPSAVPPAKTGAYRPPHARVAGVSVAPATLHEREQRAKASSIAGAPPGAGQPEQLSKAAQKNRRKREKKQQESTNTTTTTTTTKSEEGGLLPKGGSPAPEAANGQPSPEDKKVRSLLKKLRAIEELKQRQARGDKLEDTQVQKIGTEPSVRQQLELLGWRDD